MIYFKLLVNFLFLVYSIVFFLHKDYAIATIFLLYTVFCFTIDMYDYWQSKKFNKGKKIELPPTH